MTDGLAISAGQFMRDGLFAASPNLRPEPYDPEGAKRLLTEAGYPEGFGLTLHGPDNRLVNDEQIMQTIAQILTRVRIITNFDAMTYSVYIMRARKREFSAAAKEGRHHW